MLVKTNYIDKEQCDIANVKTNHKLYLVHVHAECTQSDKVTSSFLPDAAPDVMMDGLWFLVWSPLSAPVTNNLAGTFWATSILHFLIYIIGIGFDRFMFTFT